MSRLRAPGEDPRDVLPMEDPSVDALDPAVRARVGAQWQGRATAELRVASVFAVLAKELFEVGADPVVLELCARAVSDEVRHAQICLLLAGRYLARDVPWPPPGPVPLPLHAPAPESLRPTLHAAAMGCINETLASAWLEASQRSATAPLAKAAIRELMADDVHHARLGWAHLASGHVTRGMRAALAAWLPRLLEAAALPWLRDAEGYGEGVPAHGVPSRAATRAAVLETVHQVILPGFDAVGVETAPARVWVASNNLAPPGHQP